MNMQLTKNKVLLLNVCLFMQGCQVVREENFSQTMSAVDSTGTKDHTQKMLETTKIPITGSTQPIVSSSSRMTAVTTTELNKTMSNNSKTTAQTMSAVDSTGTKDHTQKMSEIVSKIPITGSTQPIVSSSSRMTAVTTTTELNKATSGNSKTTGTKFSTNNKQKTLSLTKETVKSTEEISTSVIIQSLNDTSSVSTLNSGYQSNSALMQSSPTNPRSKVHTTPENMHQMSTTDSKIKNTKEISSVKPKPRNNGNAKQHKDKAKKKLTIIIAVCGSLAGFLLLVLVLYYMIKKVKKPSNMPILLSDISP